MWLAIALQQSVRGTSRHHATDGDGHHKICLREVNTTQWNRELQQSLKDSRPVLPATFSLTTKTTTLCSDNKLKNKATHAVMLQGIYYQNALAETLLMKGGSKELNW